MDKLKARKSFARYNFQIPHYVPKLSKALPDVHRSSRVFKKFSDKSFQILCMRRGQNATNLAS